MALICIASMPFSICIWIMLSCNITSFGHILTCGEEEPVPQMLPASGSESPCTNCSSSHRDTWHTSNDPAGIVIQTSWLILRERGDTIFGAWICSSTKTSTSDKNPRKLRFHRVFHFSQGKSCNALQKPFQHLPSAHRPSQFRQIAHGLPCETRQNQVAWATWTHPHGQRWGSVLFYQGKKGISSQSIGCKRWFFHIFWRNNSGR